MQEINDLECVVHIGHRYRSSTPAARQEFRVVNPVFLSVIEMKTKRAERSSTPLSAKLFCHHRIIP
jgi:hypothetical protein